MAKPIRGRAGREQRRESLLDRYGADCAQLLLKQVNIAPTARMMHLGSPGATQFLESAAHALTTGEIVAVVYTYDEMEELRAALAGIGNVQVINEIDDFDPDEPPYDLISGIIPVHLGREYVATLLLAAADKLAPEGRMYLAGDRQQGFERNLEVLSARGSSITTLTQSGHLRVVSATRPTPGGGLRLKTP